MRLVMIAAVGEIGGVRVAEGVNGILKLRRFGVKIRFWFLVDLVLVQSKAETERLNTKSSKLLTSIRPED